MLEDNNIKYEPQKKFNWLGNQSLDFYLPSYNIGIECQGAQHFSNDNFFNKLAKVQILDARKNKLCKENGLKLIYYTELPKYTSFIGELLVKNENDLIKTIQVLQEQTMR